MEIPILNLEWNLAHAFIIPYQRYFGIGRRRLSSKQESRDYGVY